VKTIQEHSTSAMETAESDKVTTDPARRETEDETRGGMCSCDSVAHDQG
jgi:hypothetical protein